jgi:predicted  nucleic acid-binding Zn-ribbon protein
MFLGACQTAYYAAWEQVGKEKRHLLRDNVEKVGKEQQEASEQFKDVLTQIQALYGFDGGELEKAYRRLKSDYEDCEKRADDVRERTAKVEQIAKDLFREWKQELQQISNPDLRAKSRKSLYATQRRYSQLEQAMRKAERRMEPVLQKVRDYVLYLKHNLNAQAVGALKLEVGRIEVEVDSLITDLNKSIQETEAFLKNFK